MINGVPRAHEFQSPDRIELMDLIGGRSKGVARRGAPCRMAAAGIARLTLSA